MPAKYRVRFITSPTAAELKEIITLYRAQGWWKPGEKPALLRRLIAGSHCFAAAFCANRMIGIGRALSDGASDAYIQDMTVLPEYRGRGAGAAILKALIRRLRKDGIRWTALIAQDDSEKFYGKYGFRTLKKAHPMLSKGSYV